MFVKLLPRDLNPDPYPPTSQELVFRNNRLFLRFNLSIIISMVIDESKNNLDDLRETFDTLRKYKMKLNPMKYVFAVSSRKFLGFMVS